ncbi:uncharacterized protein TNCV_1895281 [Trichonephila clavipes]|nr:uncharacterized protein TNCV_1895281 [Trichonephila clavipes]
MEVRDVILSPGSINPYSKLKDEVIARCGESKSQEIRRLVAGEQLGNRKPSELFRQLPPNVQSILASIQPLSAQKASEVADRILEVTPVQVSAVSKYSSANAYDSSESKLLKELKLLRQEVKELRRSRVFLEIVSILAIAERVLRQIYVGIIINLPQRQENVFSPVLSRKT